MVRPGALVCIDRQVSVILGLRGFELDVVRASSCEAIVEQRVQLLEDTG